MRAANWGHVDTIAALVVEGADMFATDRLGRTPLDWARIARHDKAARTLERATENEIRHRRCGSFGLNEAITTVVRPKTQDDLWNLRLEGVRSRREGSWYHGGGVRQ